MSIRDIQPGGEYYELANSIKHNILEMSRLTNKKIKFIKLNPFDVYQGPYASVTINGKFDSVWFVDSDESGEDILYIERLEWTGNVYELADAINGDTSAIENVIQNTESYK